MAIIINTDPNSNKVFLGTQECQKVFFNENQVFANRPMTLQQTLYFYGIYNTEQGIDSTLPSFIFNQIKFIINLNGDAETGMFTFTVRDVYNAWQTSIQLNMQQTSYQWFGEGTLTGTFDSGGIIVIGAFDNGMHGTVHDGTIQIIYTQV